MIYDEYLNLEGLDLVPFISKDRDDKAVSRVVYSCKDNPREYIDMWIQSERNGYYLYIMHYKVEPMIKMVIAFSYYDSVKIKVAEKYGRGSVADYYYAGMKAAIFAKDIVREIYPQVKVEWELSKTWKKKMSSWPPTAKYAIDCTERSFHFDEKKFL